jgi:hypothetical protein
MIVRVCHLLTVSVVPHEFIVEHEAHQEEQQPQDDVPEPDCKFHSTI